MLEISLNGDSDVGIGLVNTSVLGAGPGMRGPGPKTPGLVGAGKDRLTGPGPPNGSVQA